MPTFSSKQEQYDTPSIETTAKIGGGTFRVEECLPHSITIEAVDKAAKDLLNDLYPPFSGPLTGGWSEEFVVVVRIASISSGHPRLSILSNGAIAAKESTADIYTLDSGKLFPVADAFIEIFESLSSCKC